MVRSVNINVPIGKKDEIMGILSSHENVSRIRSFTYDDGHEAAVHFVCVDKHLSEILRGLERSGLGTAFGSIDILALQSTIPRLAKKKCKHYRRKYKFGDRRTIREIEEIIDNGCHLTFDYIIMILVASIIAALGLLTDSPVTVVASMLISPLMGPILGVAYGSAVHNKDMIRIGLRNECWGFFLCLLMGACTGAVSTLFYAPLGLPGLTDLTGNSPLKSHEMESRGQWIALFTGFFTAAPSGVGLAIGVTNAAMNALVGVALSASLLPPLVNSGMCVTMGTIYTAASDATGSDMHFFTMGLISTLVFLLNFFTIWTFAYLTFRLKGISPSKREFQEPDAMVDFEPTLNSNTVPFLQVV
mmetsp:Transcript_3896/g.7119  ORF Transcript_3896/g.7119 Transcript_3896/m.7119 type:complete len:359 (-) Transcript_3896:29-1105(-)